MNQTDLAKQLWQLKQSKERKKQSKIEKQAWQFQSNERKNKAN